MSAQEVTAQIKALTPVERAEAAWCVEGEDDSWIPESFKQGTADADAGRFVDMETALFETPPPNLR